MLTRRHVLTSFAALGAASVASTAFAAQPQIYQVNGIALGGTDPVAYFTQGKPVSGNAAHLVRWNGADWYFASAENRAAFEANPEAYAPAYGGYCAYAVARGYTASTDPGAWHIHEDRLYLNYSRSVRLLWRADIPGNIRKADANWPQVLSA